VRSTPPGGVASEVPFRPPDWGSESNNASRATGEAGSSQRYDQRCAGRNWPCRMRSPAWAMAGTRPLSPEEEEAVLKVLPGFPLRDQCLVTVLSNCGFRITETLSMRLGDVWENGSMRPRIRVQRARMKGGRGPLRRSVAGRSVALNGTVVSALREYFFARFGSAGPADLEAPLFPSRKGGRTLTRWQANRIVHSVLAAAGIAAKGARGEFGSHSFRKQFCQKIYAATGHNLNLTRAVMGHASVLTTQRYLTVEAVEIDRAVMAIGQLEAGRELAGVHVREPRSAAN
jgi:integrase/recombinase XerD